MATLFEDLMGSFRSEANAITRNSIKENARKISAKNIKVESFRIYEDEDFDQETSFDVPEEGEEVKEGDVVLVIDPETPSDEEVPEDAAENMVGELIYKCPICAANYACNCDDEDSVVVCDEEGKPVECPVCGDTSPQILIGQIAPAEDVTEDEELLTEPETDVEAGEEKEADMEGEEEVPAEGEEEVPAEDEEEKKEESLKVEGKECKCGKGKKCPHCGKDLDEDVEEEEELEECDKKEVKESKTLNFDDVKFVNLMKNVIRENYEHDNATMRIRKAVATGKNTLRLEYVLREGRTTTRGTMIASGYNKDSRAMTLRVRDKGVFTESFTREPAFLVECVVLKGNVTPVSVKYDYKVKVNESLYRVYGETK